MGRLISEFYGRVNSEETEGSSDRSNGNMARVRVVSLRISFILCTSYSVVKELHVLAVSYLL